MRPSVSFVIPVLNEEPLLAVLLRRLRRDYPQAQLLVVDGGSSDRSVAVAMPLADQVLIGETGRAAQMNLGGRSASGDYLLFLHADSYPGFTDAELRAQLTDGPAWGFSPVRLSGGHPLYRVIEWMMNWRSRLTAVATGDQLLFLRRELFLGQGGFAEIPLMEDVELSKRLRRVSAPRILLQPTRTGSRRWEQRGILRTVGEMWMLRLAYFCGVSPRRLWRFYYG